MLPTLDLAFAGSPPQRPVSGAGSRVSFSRPVRLVSSSVTFQSFLAFRDFGRFAELWLGILQKAAQLEFV